LQLVVRLYEQVVEDLRQVGAAIDQKDIGLRTQRINHAILVIGHLQSSLDFVRGAKVARDLEQFYGFLRQNLVQLQFHPSQAAVRRLITDIIAVRSSWVEVERIESAKTTVLEAAPAPSSAGDNSQAPPARLDWKG